MDSRSISSRGRQAPSSLVSHAGTPPDGKRATLNDQVLFFLCQEGVALIGRSATAQLSFGEDMSISRSHGQFEVEMDPATGIKTIFLKDSGSRYGTTVDGVKMAANDKIPLNAPDHQIRLGANQGTIMLRVADFRFCFSQLDRGEKEELKVFITSNERRSRQHRVSHLLSNCYCTVTVIVALLEAEGPNGYSSGCCDTFSHQNLDCHH